MIRVARLFQPRNPLFWIFILLNGLSSAISFLLQTRELPWLLMLLLAGFALGNMFFGIRIALRLMRDPPAPTPSVPESDAARAS